MNSFPRLILAVILFLTSTGAGAGLKEGLDAYRSGNYHAALKEFMPLAAKGNAAAQFNLGVMNELGQGVHQNYPKAVLRYRQAAEQGYALAQFNLGVMYGEGHGVPQDYKASASWFLKAAERGNALAQFNLGVMYVKGQGVPQDDKESASWFGKAAEQGNALAQFNIGMMYLKGQGVPQDYTMAINWYMKASEQGNALAQFDLGVMYTNGEGMKVDLVQAYKWFSLAGTVPGEDVMKDRNLLEKNMTPQEIEAAQALVRDWQKKHSGHEPAPEQHPSAEKGNSGATWMPREPRWRRSTGMLKTALMLRPGAARAYGNTRGKNRKCASKPHWRTHRKWPKSSVVKAKLHKTRWPQPPTPR